MKTLTSNEQRQSLAQRLTDACPLDFASEIAITGSTARGMADETSDLEMNFWHAEAIPSLNQRIEWLKSCGAVDIEPAITHKDASDWIDCRIDGIPCEIGFQTFGLLQAAIDLLLEGVWQDDTALGDVIVRAVPLRSSGWLQTEQARLALYSDEAQEKQFFRAFHTLNNQRLAERNDFGRLALRRVRLKIIEQMLPPLEHSLRVVYALNRRWTPSYKWMFLDALELATHPRDYFARIENAFVGTENEIVDRCASIVVDTIDLIPITNDKLRDEAEIVRQRWGG